MVEQCEKMDSRGERENEILRKKTFKGRKAQEDNAFTFCTIKDIFTHKVCGCCLEKKTY